jgi:hypothetical protein
VRFVLRAKVNPPTRCPKPYGTQRIVFCLCRSDLNVTLRGLRLIPESSALLEGMVPFGPLHVDRFTVDGLPSDALRFLIKLSHLTPNRNKC